MMARSKRPHHQGGYQAQARAVRNAANADPSTRCWRCNQTKAEHKQPWQAGHLHDGQAGGILMPECRRCNASAGATYGNNLRRAFKPTRNW